MTRYRAIAVLCLAAGIIVVVGIFFDARTTLVAYLIAWVATASIPIGALALLQMTYLVHRAWTNDLHRILIAATETLPLCGLLALPILLGQAELYPAAEGSVDLPAFKAAYLSPWFFATRTIVFFRDLVRACVLGQGGVEKSGSHGLCGLCRADRLCADSFTGRHRLAPIAQSRISFLDLRASVHQLHVDVGTGIRTWSRPVITHMDSFGARLRRAVS